jgi:hypothetical protein
MTENGSGAASAARETVARISIKSVVGTIKDITGPRPLLRVYGLVRGSGHYQTDGGTSVKYTGTFEARSSSDGRDFDSDTMVLPLVAELALSKALTDAHGEPIEFAYEIGVKPTPRGVGHEFTYRELAPSKAADPLSALRQLAAPIPVNVGTEP